MEELPSPNLRLSDFDYELPAERIAQTPLTLRDRSRLLVLGRTDGSIAHKQFTDLPEYLEAGDVLIVNDTRVTAAGYLSCFGQLYTRLFHPIKMFSECCTE